MVEQSERSGNYFALGALVGAALGMAIGLLFAPRPGEETRAVLKEKRAGLQPRSRKGPVDGPASGEISRQDTIATEPPIVERTNRSNREENP
jgi:hypothetical protein